jgi:hypothetical protein
LEDARHSSVLYIWKYFVTDCLIQGPLYPKQQVGLAR